MPTHQTTLSEFAKTYTKLSATGNPVYIIPLNHIESESAFMRLVTTILPCDPPYEFESRQRQSWDALEDSLWGGNRGKSLSVIVLDNENTNTRESLKIFLRILETIDDDQNPKIDVFIMRL